MSNQPDAAKLLAIARATVLDRLLPQLPENLHYDALMVANAIAIAIREYSAGDAAARAEYARVRKLLAEQGGQPENAAPGDALAACQQRLAAEIRAGRFDHGDRAALLDHLQQTAADALAVANPRALQT